MKNLFSICFLSATVWFSSSAAAVQLAQQTPEISLSSVTSSQNAANIGQDYEGPTRTKSFTKTFALDNNDKVNLWNKYGSITIKTWERKEAKVDIQISAFSDNESDVQKLLDEISIDAVKNGDVVNFRTVQKDLKGSFGTRIRNGKITWKREVKVHYIVFMPATNALTAAQQYGNIELGNFSAPTSLKVQYGNLTAGILSNSNNYINVQYGKTTIDEVNKAVLKHQYGGGITLNRAGAVDLDVQYAQASLKSVSGNVRAKVQYGEGLYIGSAHDLVLDAQYAKVKIEGLTGNATIEQQYSNLSMGSVNKLTLKTEYAGVTIAALKGDASIDMEYDRLNIGSVGSGCKTLSVKSNYTDISMAFANGFNASLAVETDYAGFKYSGNVQAKAMQDDDDRSYSSTKNYSGKIGTGGTGSVRIRAEYGSVTLR